MKKILSLSALVALTAFLAVPLRAEDGCGCKDAKKEEPKKEEPKKEEPKKS